MDHQLTLRMKQWLDAKEHTDREDINAGALMLLQLNRNQAMYNTIVRSPERYVDKIRYELNKFLPSRLAGMTMDDVVTMEAAVLPPVKAAIEAEPKDAEKQDVLPLHKGKRADHDQLPDEIKNIWTRNAERWKKIKAAFNTCLSLTQPCDRYEHVTLMRDTWYLYKSDFARYDEYKIETEDDKSASPASVDPAKLASEISSAQKYVSKYASLLIELRTKAMSDDATEKQTAAYEEKRQKMYAKVLFLFENGKTLSDALLSKLAEGGVEVARQRPFDPDLDSIG